MIELIIACTVFVAATAVITVGCAAFVTAVLMHLGLLEHY